MSNGSNLQHIIALQLLSFWPSRPCAAAAADAIAQIGKALMHTQLFNIALDDHDPLVEQHIKLQSWASEAFTGPNLFTCYVLMLWHQLIGEVLSHGLL